MRRGRTADRAGRLTGRDSVKIVTTKVDFVSKSILIGDGWHVLCLYSREFFTCLRNRNIEKLEHFPDLD